MFKLLVNLLNLVNRVINSIIILYVLKKNIFFFDIKFMSGSSNYNYLRLLLINKLRLGVLQESVLRPLLFSIYHFDLFFD